jgi:hypothetical protein
MDLLFVGGGFENFNWLAEFAVQIPRIVSICMFNRRAIDPMKFVVQPPSFGAICLFTCGAIDPMKFAVQIPIFGAVCIFNRRTIDPMKFVVQIPIFVAIWTFNCRAIDPMKFAVQIPLFGAVGRDFANWLLVQLLIPPIWNIAPEVKHFVSCAIYHLNLKKIGTPARTQTWGFFLRRETLYSTELRAHIQSIFLGTKNVRVKLDKKGAFIEVLLLNLVPKNAKSCENFLRIRGCFPMLSALGGQSLKC